ncbi:MAG: glycosyltransferase family 4 protein [Rhodospirillales bacterium]
MRVAFYAPMKAPDHPVPSGDRAVARLLLQALRHGGHEAALASRLRSWQGQADPARQARLARLGAALAQRLLRRYAADPAQRPQAWLTYHLYYKAPDFIGPAVARALGIPYLLAEVSLAYKRAGGPWDLGHRASLEAVRTAGAILQLNPEDAECLPPDCRQELLPPFLDARPFTAAYRTRAETRATWAARLGLDLDQPWLIAVAMMRPGDKLASYRRLAAALGQVTDLPWQLLLIGDGPARPQVEAAFATALGSQTATRLRYLGELPEGGVAAPLVAADLFVWPAVNEAYGMAALEAQAAGLPVVAGWRPGLVSIVAQGESGLLVESEGPEAFAGALRSLLTAPARVRAMGAEALRRVAARHDLAAAAATLSRVLGSARPPQAGP